MQKKNKRKVYSFLKAGRGFVFLAIILISAFLYTVSIQDVIENKPGWHNIAMADADPGAGASGVLRQYIVDNDVFDYSTNITVNASVYAAGQVNDSHINSTVPYGAAGAHDIVWEVRFNTTHAWNSTKGDWDVNLVRGNITCAGHSLSDQAMDEYEITNNSNFIWMHYVWDGTLGAGGTGETISRGENITSVLIACGSFY